MLGLQKLTTKIITFSEAPCGLRVLAQKTMPPCTWDLFLSNRGHSLSHYHHFNTFLSNFCFLFQHSCSFNFSSVSFFLSLFYFVLVPILEDCCYFLLYCFILLFILQFWVSWRWDEEIGIIDLVVFDSSCCGIPEFWMRDMWKTYTAWTRHIVFNFYIINSIWINVKWIWLKQTRVWVWS